MLLVAALLLAVPEPESPAAAGKLTIALGTVEAKAAGESDYKALKVGDEFEPGAWIRTGAGVKAWFQLGQGTELRVNENTELLIEPLKIELKAGRYYLQVPKGVGPIDLKTPLHQMKTAGCILDLEFKPRVPNGDPALTNIAVLDGVVQALSKKFSPNITTGYLGTAVGNQLNTPDSITYIYLHSQWVHPLLRERGIEDAETAGRTGELLTMLGKNDEGPIAEAALRNLGSLAVPKLAEFLDTSDKPTHVARRAAATRLIAESATLKQAGLLLPRLDHKEAEVRLAAAKGLARLAGKDLGFNDGYWKGTQVADGKKAWEEWVKANSK